MDDTSPAPRAVQLHLCGSHGRRISPGLGGHVTDTDGRVDRRHRPHIREVQVGHRPVRNRRRHEDDRRTGRSRAPAIAPSRITRAGCREGGDPHRLQEAPGRRVGGSRASRNAGGISERSPVCTAVGTAEDLVGQGVWRGPDPRLRENRGTRHGYRRDASGSARSCLSGAELRRWTTRHRFERPWDRDGRHRRSEREQHDRHRWGRVCGRQPVLCSSFGRRRLGVGQRCRIGRVVGG